MKRIFLIVTVILIVSTFISCNKLSNSDNLVAKVNYPESITFDNFEKQREVIDKNKLDADFINSINDFSYATSSKVLSGINDNINYSPVSFYMALSMAATGAGNNSATKDEIYKLLSLKNNSKDYLLSEESKLFRLLYSDNKVTKLKLANSIWLDNNFNYKDDFTKNLTKYLYSSIYNVDFSDKTTSKEMSNWISDNTNGILNPKIELPSDSIMSIINTIYFKDEWIDRFDVNDTKEDTFYLYNNTEVKCDFMNRTYVSHSFVKGDGFTSSELGMKGNSSMVFILPDKDTTVDSLLDSKEKISVLFNSPESKNGKVIFQIPKFDFGSKLDLKEVAKSLGVTAAFESNANFSAITDVTAYISGIKQENHIAIDEKGVEAAAFTQIDYCGSAAPEDTVAEMILNRPFIYAIKDYNGVILFIGVCNNPTVK